MKFGILIVRHTERGTFYPEKNNDPEGKKRNLFDKIYIKAGEAAGKIQ